MQLRNVIKTLSLFFICLLGKLQAQSDSVIFDAAAGMPDRIYLTYNDFRNSRGITREEIEWPGDKTQLEFFTKVLQSENFSYRRDGTVLKAESRRIWGYWQNNWLYLNYKGEFYRVPVFGAICYMVANVTVNLPGYYDPRFGYSTGMGTTTEVHEFLMNFYEGIITDLSVKEALELFKRDATIYEEYKSLRRGAQKNELYRYIRRFNAAHPVYFLR